MDGPTVERRRQVQNRLLRSLSRDNYQHVAPCVSPASLHAGQPLHADGDIGPYVYFPVRGICSVRALTESGQGIDVGTIGCEGVTSIVELVSPGTPIQVFAATPADVLRMRVQTFHEHLVCCDLLRELVSEFHRAFVSDIVQSVACNRLHSTRQRYARRLLILADREGHDAFNLTHDMMSLMLGTTRPNVTALALSLKRAGILEYERGRMTICDRSRLEATACDCYRISRQRMHRLLPPPMPMFVHDGMRCHPSGLLR